MPSLFKIAKFTGVGLVTLIFWLPLVAFSVGELNSRSCVLSFDPAMTLLDPAPLPINELKNEIQRLKALLLDIPKDAIGWTGVDNRIKAVLTQIWLETAESVLAIGSANCSAGTPFSPQARLYLRGPQQDKVFCVPFDSGLSSEQGLELIQRGLNLDTPVDSIVRDLDIYQVKPLSSIPLDDINVVLSTLLKLIEEDPSFSHVTRDQLAGLASIESLSKTAQRQALSIQRISQFLGPVRDTFKSNKVSLPLAPVEQILLSELADLVPGEAFLPKLFGFPEGIERVLQQFRDSEAGRGVDPYSREELEEAMINPTFREKLLAAAEAHLQKQSLAFDRRHSADPEAILDLGIVGQGPAESIIQNYLAQNAYPLSTSTHESGSRGAETFFSSGFVLNSSSKPTRTTSLRQVFGEGNLNFLPGNPIQPNAISGAKNPPAEVLYGAITVGRALVQNPVSYEDRVEAVRPVVLGSGKKVYVLRTEKGTYRRRAIIHTGRGAPIIPPIKGLREAYERSRQEKTEYGFSQIMTYKDLQGFFRASDRPLDAFSGLRIGIIGGKDSGQGAALSIFGLFGETANKRSKRNIAPPSFAAIYNLPYDTCDAFEKATRVFYHPLGPLIRSKAILPMDKAATFRMNPDGSFRLGTDKSSALSNNLVSRRQDRDLDVIIIATGYDSDLKQIYRAFWDKESQNLSTSALIASPRYFRNLMGWEPSLSRVVPIAKQLINQKGQLEDIFILGSLADDLVTTEEKDGQGANSVSLAANTWRVWLGIESISLYLNGQTNLFNSIYGYYEALPRQSIQNGRSSRIRTLMSERARRRRVSSKYPNYNDPFYQDR